MKVKTHRLGELCRMVKGTSPTLKTPPGEYPMVVTAEFRRTSDSWQLEGPAVCIPLISSTGHGDAALHRVHYQEGKFALANLLVALLPNDSTVCDANYLYHLLTTRKDELLVPLMQGTANVSLKERDIAGVEIPLPPLAEQRRVVVRIEDLASQIHEARSLRHQASEEAELLIPRAISSFLNDAGWTASPLGELLAEKPRNGLGPQQEVYFNGRAMLRINAVSSSPTRYVEMTAAKEVQVDDKQAEQFVIRNDDVFIVRYNGDINRVAKAAIYKGANESRVIYPDKLMRLRPNSAKITPDFLVLALGSRTVRAQIEELGKTTAGNIGISGSDVQSFVVPVPPLAEQNRIVAKLDTLQEKVDVLKRLQAETATELDALLPAVLDRAFKGEL